MNPEYSPLASPSPLPPEQLPSPTTPSRVPLWRWYIGTFIMGLSPLLTVLAASSRAATGEGVRLPSSTFGLLFLSAVELALFGIVWGLAWAFARGSKDELLLRWRKSWSVLGWGAFYSVAMRFALGFVMLFGLIALAILGFDMEKMVAVLKENGQGAAKTFVPVMQEGSPTYRFLMLTLMSFIVAGLREELWRTFTLVGLLKIMPGRWNENVRNGFALAMTCILFGSAHAYQGLTGIAQTTALGVVLGAIILYHRSIWPAVIAHGCFNATSFIMLMALPK